MGYRINHAKVVAQANSIADNASQLAAQIKLITQMEQDCRSAWKGQAADTFIARLNMLRNNMSRTRSQMSNLSATIKYCADRIQREDEEAARRAATLKSMH